MCMCILCYDYYMYNTDDLFYFRYWTNMFESYMFSTCICCYLLSMVEPHLLHFMILLYTI